MFFICEVSESLLTFIPAVLQQTEKTSFMFAGKKEADPQTRHRVIIPSRRRLSMC